MASPFTNQSVRALPFNLAVGVGKHSAAPSAASGDSGASHHASTANSSQRGTTKTSKVLHSISSSQQHDVSSTSYTVKSPQAAFDYSEYNLAIPFPQVYDQNGIGLSLDGSKGSPRPFRLYRAKLQFVSMLSTCISSITLFTSRNVDQIFERLGRQLRRKDTQYNRTVEDTLLSHMSLIVFLDKQKLAGEYLDSADVVEELEGIYPGLLKILRFPSWDGEQHDLLQICIKMLPKAPPARRYGIESFEWFIWHVANRQLYQGHYQSISGDVDVFWGDLKPEGYTNDPVEIAPGFSTSWFRDNSSKLSIGQNLDVAAQASRIKPQTLRLVTFDKHMLPGELCVVCKHKILAVLAIRTPGDTYCCSRCHMDLFEKCHICTEFSHKPKLTAVTCGHKFCTECLVHAFESGTKSLDSFPPRCCGQDLSLQSHRKALPPRVLTDYISLLQKRAEKNDIVCATPACEKRSIKGHFIVNQWGICEVCHDLTCSRCGSLEGDHISAKEPRTCPISEQDKPVFELAEANKWKACPKCGNMVERSDGCNDMVCRCGQGFCYTCGVAFELRRSCACPVHFELERALSEDGRGEVDVTDT